jgi:hypothetical protein
MGPSLGEVGHHLAGEAVVADAGHGPFHAGLVPRVAHAGGVDDEAARLRVFEEGGRQPGLQGIRPLDDRLGVIGDQDAEDPLVERPGGLARLDRRLGGFPEHRVDEPVAGEDGGEDPGAEAPAAARGVGRQVRHPAGVELDFLPGTAIGERDRRRGAPPAEFSQGEAPEHGIADQHPLASEQLADLGQPYLGPQVPRDDVPLGRAHGPAVAMRPPRPRLDGADDRGEQAIVQLVGTGGRRQPLRLRGAQVPPNRLDVQAQLGGDPLFADAGQPEPQDLFDLEHRDLAIGHAPSPAPLGGRKGHSPRSRKGGKLLQNPPVRGPMLLKNSG